MIAVRAHEGETEPRLVEVERPVAGDGEVLIEVRAAGLAPSVLEMWRRGMYPVLPQTLGHEGAGTIAAVGPGVTGLADGDRVRLHPVLSCRACAYCLAGREPLCPGCSVIGQGIFGPAARPLYERYHDGALATHVLAPAWAVDPLPPTITFQAAAKVHSIAVALHAWRAAAPPPGATVVLTAATGAVGPTAIRMAGLFGVRRLIAVARSRERLAAVRTLAPALVETLALEDLDHDWNETQGLTKAIRTLVPGGADVVIDFLPEGPGTSQAISSLAPGGTAVVMSGNVTTPALAPIAVMANCWRIIGARACTRADAGQVMRWLDDGTLEVGGLITHRFDLAEISTAAALVRERSEPVWMLVVEPSE
jgi:threonine dehydrogenase-like Zn-dependent dehydrogenase